jgi:23S rRNA (uracil1939-C5)-methyltransferase
MHVRDRLTLTIEKPAAGGYMIARHDGQVVLVTGAIPGERVVAAVTRADRAVAYANTVEVLEPSADRRMWAGDWTCGGASYAFVAYERQLALKAEIVADAFARIGRMPLTSPVPVAASPERGYRMRARLHVNDGRIGFFREATHELCDPASTGQLSGWSSQALEAVRMKLKAIGFGPVSGIELAENVDLTERVIHLHLRAGTGVRTSTYATLAGTRGLTGVTCALSTGAAPVRLGGEPFVHDMIDGGTSLQTRPATLRRHVLSFFQGNRFLVQTLVDSVRGVVTAAPADEVLDLYAGVGLFAVALAGAGWRRIAAVEGDRSSAEDLAANARAFEGSLVTHAKSVEEYLRRRTAPAPATAIVDPPRTGLSRDAVSGVVALGADQIVYVSCDVATLARDARRIVDAGYRLASLQAFDLFPNTPHVETLATFTRTEGLGHP